MNQTGQNSDVFINHLKSQSPLINGDVPQEVVNHVLDHVVAPTHVSSICIDGGYVQEQAGGELARAGDDTGLCMALLALGFSPNLAFDLVLKFRIAKNQKYGWHTDTHEGHDHVIIGCGHVNNAITQGQYYGVNGKDVLNLINLVKDYTNQNPDQFLYHVLDRQHMEQGILVIVSHKFTIQPWRKKSHQDQTQQSEQFFVYDQARDQLLMAELWQFILKTQQAQNNYLEINYQKISLTDLKNTVAKQTNATLGLLASSQGKPIYEIGLTDSGNRLTITHAGFAPTRGTLSNSY